MSEYKSRGPVLKKTPDQRLADAEAALAETTAVLDAVYRDKCATALCEMCGINLAGILDNAENVLKAAGIKVEDLFA